MTQKIKKILVFSPLYPPHVGGLESHAADWNTHMANQGYEVTVWTPQVPPTGKRTETTNGVRILRYPAFELIPNYPLPNIFHGVFWQQLRDMWASPYDVAVTRTRFFASSALGILFAKLHGIPTLHIEHGSDFVHSRNGATNTLAWLYDKTIGVLVLKSAMLVVANSKASADFVQTISGRAVNAVIHRGVRIDDVAAIQPHTYPGNRVVITFVGRLIDGKGIHDLLDALHNMEYTNWIAWIIGDGPERHRLEKQARQLKLQNNITFLGELPWRDTIAHLKASSIFVHPSYTEGLPTSVIEAGLSDTCIVATNVGGTPEIISGTGDGIFFAPGDVTALTSALDTLCNNPNMRRKYATAAKRSIMGRFSWQACIDAYKQTLHTSL